MIKKTFSDTIKKDFFGHDKKGFVRTKKGFGRLKKGRFSEVIKKYEYHLVNWGIILSLQAPTIDFQV